MHSSGISGWVCTELFWFHRWEKLLRMVVIHAWSTLETRGFTHHRCQSHGWAVETEIATGSLPLPCTISSLRQRLDVALYQDVRWALGEARSLSSWGQTIYLYNGGGRESIKNKSSERGKCGRDFSQQSTRSALCTEKGGLVTTDLQEGAIWGETWRPKKSWLWEGPEEEVSRQGSLHLQGATVE